MVGALCHKGTFLRQLPAPNEIKGLSVAKVCLIMLAWKSSVTLVYQLRINA